MFASTLLVLGLLVTPRSAPAEADLITQIDKIRQEFQIPAVAAGVVSNGSVLFKTCLGIRQVGENAAVQMTDRFHIGSNTKAVTSFIAGRLVDRGKISWDTRFFDLFPELRPDSHAGFHPVTLRDLLSHRSGITPFKGKDQWHTIDKARETFRPRNLVELRTAVVSYALRQEPFRLTEEKPIHYSNLGYALAAMMLEKAAGKSYELLLAELRTDLDLNFHIGWPRLDGPDQPEGHMIPAQQGFGDATTLMPIPKEIEESQEWRDWVYLCRPAGDLSVSLPDYLKFLDLATRSLDGAGFPLKSDTAREILRRQMGWGSHETQGIRFYDAAGSLCTFNSLAVIYDEPKIALAVMMNTGNLRSLKGMYQIKQLLEKTFVR